jgi:hypothetical protein
MSEYPHLAKIAAPDKDGVWRYTSGAECPEWWEGVADGLPLWRDRAVTTAGPSTWSTKTAAEILEDVNTALTKVLPEPIPSTFCVLPSVYYRLRWSFITVPAMRLLVRKRRRPARFSVRLK